ncbi:DNA-binding helix-turn-helix protein [Leptospira broomii serovar Hurstbridge str. 5399]|uniref:DNA-binding helix-turn-helix protein n=1 Tax=Leptospira broomii serovar Hurstbridge str. 5399 TaxID=1049789 RepID=T0EWS9_9LEPT|nr:helix-turn-helix domain-containing protein [Leptospira broomii]EQA43335.1 DNA-binding helix-turn-helix protein [Leptospira broomii serovar Hurstbridge str. 5399]
MEFYSSMNRILGFSVLFGASLAWLLAIGQIFKKGKTSIHWLLAGMLFLLGIWQGQTALNLLDSPSEILAPYSLLNLPAAYAFVPLFYAFGRKLSKQDFETRRWGFISLLLGLASLLLELYYLGYWANQKNLSWKELALAVWADPNENFTPPLLLSFFSYGPRFLSILISGLLVAYASFATGQDADWPRRRASIILLSILGGSGAGLSMYAQWLGRLKSDLHGYGAMIVTLSICGIYFYAQRFPLGFEFSKSSTGAKKSRLTGLDRIAVDSRLQICMETERVFTTEDLTLSTLASLVSFEGPKITPEQLSEFINSEYKKNFNQYVNGYRIKEACELLLEQKDRSVLSIALSVGFNSKSSFHSAFKSFTGMSPVEYRNSSSKR